MVTSIAGIVVVGSFARGFIVPSHIRAHLKRERMFQAALDAERYGDPKTAQRFLESAVRWDLASRRAAA